MEKSKRMNDINQSEEDKKRSLYDFIYKINIDEDLPMKVIDKFIINNIKKIYFKN